MSQRKVIYVKLGKKDKKCHSVVISLTFQQNVLGVSYNRKGHSIHEEIGGTVGKYFVDKRNAKEKFGSASAKKKRNNIIRQW